MIRSIKQGLAVLSAAAVGLLLTAFTPSSAQAQANASSVCDVNVSKGRPVSAFVMSVSWKSPTTTRSRPSGLVAEQLTAAE